MRLARIALTVTGAAWLAVAALAAQGAADPITWALATQTAGATATPGQTITLALTATIDEGWHLYAIHLEPGGPVATSITVPEGQIFTSAGDIGEPLPVSSFDPNFNRVLEYHETKAVFTVPVRASATARPGRQTVHVMANYQTCNDRLCLPPREAGVSVEVTILPAGNTRRNAP
jgi:thiol:disulfide interchange protein DsbD